MLFDKIYGRFIHWEIFNEKQLQNGIDALQKIQDESLINLTDNNIPIKLSKILKSSHYPETIRLKLIDIFYNI